MITHIKAILWKQGKDTFKNKEILVQFVMFPVLTVIMENAMEIKGMPEHFFANLFAVMYLGMAPLVSMAAILAEEKEKNTLRVLLMSDVKAIEYFLGAGIYLFGICMLGAGVIGFAGGYRGSELALFLAAMAVGNLISILAGAAIGTYSRTQMMATSLTVPVMLVLAFLPMLAMFNGRIAKVAKYSYTGQMSLLLNSMGNGQKMSESLCIAGANLLVAVILFVTVYRRKGLE